MKVNLGHLALCVPFLLALISFGTPNMDSVGGQLVAPVCGDVGELTCASTVAGETCDPSVKWENGDADPTSDDYYVSDTLNTCGDKNPNTSCTGSGNGAKRDDGCITQTVPVELD